MKKATVKYLLLAWLVVIASSKFPGKVEGWVFPVIGKPSVHVMANPKSNSNDVLIQYNELRPCTLNSISWLKEHEDGTRIRVSSFIDNKQILEGSPNDNTRAITWTMLASGPIDLKGSSAILEYNCHIFWPTYMRIDNLR